MFTSMPYIDTITAMAGWQVFVQRVSGTKNSPISLPLSAEDFRGKLANGADDDSPGRQ